MAAGCLLLILLLALGLRLYRVEAQSLWHDEGTSVALAQRDLATIARDAAQDIHPPLYYWILSGWVRLVGTEEGAVRSLSALLGVVLVLLTYAVGRQLAGRVAGLASSLLAAIHPFQVYYAQEARMYVLLAVLTTGAMLALIHMLRRPFVRWLIPGLALVLLEATALYTHYSSVFVIAALNLSFALWLALTWGRSPAPWQLFMWWAVSQVCVLLLYLPWLPTSIRQVASWPGPEQSAGWLPALVTTWRWLVFGPTIETGNVAVGLVAAALLVVVGLVSWGGGRNHTPAYRRQWLVGTLLLWIALPVVLMLALGLYREAYLKFLLTATPAFAVLLASGLPIPPSTACWGSMRTGPTSSTLTSEDRANSKSDAAASVAGKSFQVMRLARYTLCLGQYLAAVSVLVGIALALRNLYADPAYARDNYRDIAAYVHAVGRPGDTILLNAPGQQEVFDYYYSSLDGELPVYPLPESRPLVPAATEATLVELSRPGGRVLAILWATEESDPDRFIEGWLDSHLYKALNSWYGNVRLAIYAVPEETPSTADHVVEVPLRDAVTGDEIILHGFSLLNHRLAAGDIGQFTLFWGVDRTPTERYKVFLHVLDGANQVVGQRDAEPGGGARLTTLWTPGEVIVDNYGVPIHPATPPGEYRVEMGMYSLETGQRLLTPDGSDEIWLEPLTVDRPATGIPVVALGMQRRTDAVLGELTLVGYDTHKLGLAHQLDARLRPGDMLHVALYWRVERHPSRDWQMAIDLLGSDGQAWAGIVGEPVGNYPTSSWRAGDVWRGQFNLAVPDTLTSGRYRLRIRLLAPDGSSPARPFLSELIPIRP